MDYHFKVHNEGNGFWAECLELEGCVTEGDTMTELERNAGEALNLYLEEPAGSQISFPLPNAESNGSGIIAIPVEPGIALSVVLRSFRAANKCTQKEMADRLGMKNLFSYQRLERRSNPSLKTLQKIKRLVPELSVDELLHE